MPTSMVNSSDFFIKPRLQIKMKKLELYRDLPGYQLLKPEQKITVDRWDDERKAYDEIFNKLIAADKTKDQVDWEAVKIEMKNKEFQAIMCEHGRHWSSNCANCNEIEKILRPELYCKTEDCPYPIEEEEREKGAEYCDMCRYDQNPDEDE